MLASITQSGANGIGEPPNGEASWSQDRSDLERVSVSQ